MWNAGESTHAIINELGGGVTVAQIYSQRKVLDLPERPRGFRREHAYSRVVQNPHPRTQPLPEIREPQAFGTADIHTLGAHMCKWPIGDPADASFAFCGRKTPGKDTYCIEHARVAYQPHAKKGSETSELTRSLRRYI